MNLTLDFYRRNCIEGLFLSSGIVRSPDHTMAQIVEVARRLREEHDFRGYIPLKTIPDASPELLAAAGRHADRLSINIELPKPAGLAALAPQKDAAAIKRSMARLRLHIDEARDARRPRATASQAGTAWLTGLRRTSPQRRLQAPPRSGTTKPSRRRGTGSAGPPASPPRGERRSRNGGTS